MLDRQLCLQKAPLVGAFFFAGVISCQAAQDCGADSYDEIAHIEKVYDGDTITVDVDLGFGIMFKGQKIRLIRINAPEIRGSERESGLKSRDALRSLISNKWVILKTYKDKKGKYGRWLAEVFINETCVNDWLISEGLAKEY